MRVVVDTCVWSLSLRRRSRTALSADEQRMVALLTEAIQDGRVLMLGPIRQEILSGIRDEEQFTKTTKLLDPFPDEELATADYVEAARLFNVCQTHGVQCGAVDMLLCAAAARRRCTILTSDQGLMRCIHVLETEGLLPSRG